MAWHLAAAMLLPASQRLGSRPARTAGTRHAGGRTQRPHRLALSWSLEKARRSFLASNTAEACGAARASEQS